MNLSFSCLAVIWIFLVGSAGESRAHGGGTTAYAVPLQHIQIDGDLGDWPAGMIHYPIIDNGYFYGPTDIDRADLRTSPDLSPSFRVGFDEAEQLLYVAVRVRDDWLKIGPSYKQTDACEVYIDGDHSGERRFFWFTDTAADMASLQYVAIPGAGSYGSFHQGNPSVILGDIGRTRTRMAYRRLEDTTVYEWAVEVLDPFPDTRTRLAPGTTIGFDLVVVDKDSDRDNPARIGWAPFGAYKYLNAHFLGDLVLVDDIEDLGSLTGRVTEAETGAPRQGVTLLVEDREGQTRGRTTTRADGRFHIPVQPGSLRVAVAAARGAEPIEVAVAKGARIQGLDFAPEAVETTTWQGLSDSIWIFKAGVGAFLAFAMLHLFLFLFYPRQPANFYYAIFTSCTAALLYVNFQMEMGTGDQAAQRLMTQLFGLGHILVFLAGIRFLYALFYTRLPRPFWLFLVLGLVTAVWTWSSNTFGSFVFVLIAIPEMLRVTIAAIRSGKGRAWIIFIGFVVFTFFWLHQLLMFLNVLEPGFEYSYIYGFIGLLVPMSIYLARDFALTNKDLEVQLLEVQRLSEIAIAQERRARQEEVERQLLEAENQRKSRELEEARQLQISMLPNTSPSLPHLDIGFDMKTATEVGGDYCDFHLADDQTLTVAIGDATGHGLRPGIVVAVTKGLFETLGGEADCVQILHKISRGIRSLNIRLVHMAMSLVRLQGNRIWMTGGGMPPILIYRAATGQVEEILFEGMPLGASSQPIYQEQKSELGPGDVVLMMSDGLPERLNEADEMLEYPRTAALFAEAADKTPTEICAHLAQGGDQWANGRPQDDDITFVVLKARV